jgi:hypothetical protein
MAITKLIADSITSGAIASTPAFCAVPSSDQSISNTTSTKLNFQTELWDTDNAFDNSTNYRFTVPSGKAGKYFFSARFLIRSGDNKVYLIKIHLNGSAYFPSESLEVTGGGSSTAGAQTQVIMDLDVGDYVEVFVYHSTGSSKDTYQNYTIFQGYKIIE